VDIGEAFKHVDERPGPKKQGFEPSGLAYHPKRKTLFVVSDDGPIAELAVDGTVKNYWHSAYYDREGIAFRPADGCLYRDAYWKPSAASGCRLRRDSQSVRRAPCTLAATT
jgi:hypothetical protein